MILSINSGIGSSVALFNEGKVVIALQEERFTRVKNFMGFPHKALEFILKNYGSVADIKWVALCNLADHQITNESFYKRYDDAFKDGVKGKTYSRYTFQGKVARSSLLGGLYNRLKNKKHALKNRKDVQELLTRGFIPSQIYPVEHHLCHAASAYYGLAQETEIPYLILTADGGGDDVTTAVWKGHQGHLEKLSDSNCYSLGNMYSMVTHFLGFRSHEHEYKLMGLSPYVNPKYAEKYAQFFEQFLDLEEDDTQFFNPIPLEHRRFAHELVKTFINDRFDNISAGLQLFSERITCRWLKGLIKKYRITHILGSGGTFMNVKINKLLSEDEQLDFIDVFPSCGDESNIFGAYYYLDAVKNNHKRVSRLSSYTVGSVPTLDLEQSLLTFKDKLSYKRVDNIHQDIAEKLADHKLIARVSGPMEFGARALGNRSILANPSRLKNVSTINRAVKKRDFWMPFAPIVLNEKKEEYVILPKSIQAHGSPYMMFATETKAETRDDMICAIHQADFTARPEIVNKSRYPDLYKILTEFNKKTGIGVLLNTSYNLHGFPIVENSHQAIEVFLQTELDYLVIESTIIWKI